MYIIIINNDKIIHLKIIIFVNKIINYYILNNNQNFKFI